MALELKHAAARGKKCAKPNKRGKQSHRGVTVFLSTPLVFLPKETHFGETPSLQFEGEYRYSSNLSGEIPLDPMYPTPEDGEPSDSDESDKSSVSLWNAETLACQKK